MLLKAVPPEKTTKAGVSAFGMQSSLLTSGRWGVKEAASFCLWHAALRPGSTNLTNLLLSTLLAAPTAWKGPAPDKFSVWRPCSLVRLRNIQKICKPLVNQVSGTATEAWAALIMPKACA